jgi:hypothetical protein
MDLRPQTRSGIADLGEQLHLDLTPEEVEDFRKLVERTLPVYETVEDYGPPDSDVRKSSGASTPAPAGARTIPTTRG